MPAGHCTHAEAADCAVPELAVPAAQFVHDASELPPAAVLYVPCGQAMQVAIETAEVAAL